MKRQRLALLKFLLLDLPRFQKNRLLNFAFKYPRKFLVNHHKRRHDLKSDGPIQQK